MIDAHQKHIWLLGKKPLKGRVIDNRCKSMTALVVTSLLRVGCAGCVANFIRHPDVAQLTLQFIPREEISHRHSGRAKGGIIFVKVWFDAVTSTL